MGSLPISGYILAGGRSTRMGKDKAELQLAGKTLAERAVTMLSSICERTRIVTANAALHAIAPTIADQFVNCGPLGGIEAALRDTHHDRILVLPVDLPFVPRALLHAWTSAETAMVSYLEADGQPQPLICLLHRSILLQVQQALRAGHYKLMRVYEEIASDMQQPLHRVSVDSISWSPTPLDNALRPFWFSNLNTPEEFVHAERALRNASAMGY